MLYYADPTKEFLLDTDASYVAIGACLGQVREIDGEETEVPIAFASKTLSESRRAYCTTKKELYAIVVFMRYWQSYVAMAKHVRIRTDHGSLRWLMMAKIIVLQEDPCTYDGLLKWRSLGRGLLKVDLDAFMEMLTECQEPYTVTMSRPRTVA